MAAAAHPYVGQYVLVRLVRLLVQAVGQQQHRLPHQRLVGYEAPAGRCHFCQNPQRQALNLRQPDGVGGLDGDGGTGLRSVEAGRDGA